MEDITNWGSLALQIVATLVGLLMLTLRQAVSFGFTSWAENQTEQKDTARILKLKEIVDSGLETVELNIVAEAQKDLRAALVDGRLDEAERKSLRAKIASYGRTTLSTEGVAAAKLVYDVADDKLDDWMANRVEGRVVAAMRIDQ